MSNTQATHHPFRTVIDLLHPGSDNATRRHRHNLAAWTSLVAHNAMFGAASAPVFFTDFLRLNHLIFLVWMMFLIMVFMYPIGVTVIAGHFAQALYVYGGRPSLIGFICTVTSLGSWAVVMYMAFEIW